MVAGEAQQSHREPVHVRVERRVEPMQRRQRARRAGEVLRRHERPQQPVDVFGGVLPQDPPLVAGAEGAEG